MRFKRWTRVAWVVGLAPIFGGCHTIYHPRHDLAAEHVVAASEQQISREIHRKARDAWQEVRCQYSRKIFTPEFRDGFLDGYADYLDRGGDAQPPAVPPLRYTQNKKYFTPEGHVLVRDYFLGFKYGTEVAVATGQRQFLTVPVLIPEKTDLVPSGPVDHMPSPPPAVSGSDRPVPPIVNPAPQPLPAPKAMSKLPMPRTLPKGEKPGNVSTAPVIIEPEGSKFGPVPPMRSLVPNPGVPTAPMPSIPTIPSVPPFPKSPSSQGDSPAVEQAGGVTLPEPPDEVPSLPDYLPTPPNRDVYVPLPPNHSAPAPLPANHPEPMKK